MTANPVPINAYGSALATYGTAEAAWSVSAPTLVDSGEWGTFKVVVGATWDVNGTAYPSIGTAVGDDGTDVTAYARVDALQFGEPYSELTGQVTLYSMGSASPFESMTFGSTPWSPGQHIDVYRVNGTATIPYWHGFIASVELSDGPGLNDAVSLQCMGALFGEASLRSHQPVLLDNSVDIGTSLGRALDLRPGTYARPFTPWSGFQFTTSTLGINTRRRGSRGQMVIDYVDEMLSIAQEGVNQFTIWRDYDANEDPVPRAYCNAAKYTEYGDNTRWAQQVWAGSYGVDLRLTCDLTAAPNAVYGEGVYGNTGGHLAGSRWRNMKYPGLLPSQPAYPDRVVGSDYPVTEGDTDADFTTDVVTQLQYALRLAGMPDVTITGIFDADTTTALYDLQEDAGETPTGEITSDADWDVVWGGAGSSTGDVVAGYGYARPLSEVVESAYYLYAGNGAVIGDNDTGPTAYDGRIRVEQTISFADGIAKSRARVYARRIATQAIDGPPWFGTITLTSDVLQYDGVTARSRFDIREGGWIRVHNLDGGSGNYRDFYIAGVDVSPEAGAVTLTVSEKAWDLLDLSTRIERDREARKDPARSFYSLRNRAMRPFRDAVGWDSESGAGIIAKQDVVGSQWNMIRMVGSQSGSIASLRAVMSDDTGYCMAVFGGSVAGTALDALIPAPLGTVAGDYPSHWQHPDNLDQLESWGFVEAWGSNGEAAGYFPGAQSIGAGSAGSATGVTEDAGSWTFASLDAPFLWVGVWPDTAGTPTFKATFRIITEE